ncbi:MAG: ComEC/Rec2 family competence protein [Clostridiales bacterium]|nr:ComEC/Rec2 family competence protein [Clostridiales bacterium]
MRNLEKALEKRPVVIPAALMIICSVTCYHFSSFLPSLFAGIAVASAGFLIMIRRFRERGNGMPVLIISLMLSLLLIHNGVFISGRLNAAAARGGLNCVVTESRPDLSGGLDLTVRLDDGPLAKVNFYCEHEDLYPGDSLILYGKLKEPDKAGNPGEFDYRDYLRRKGILYTISCERYSVRNRAAFPENITGMLQSLFFRFRKSVFGTVTASFDGECRALAAAVCLGDRSLLTDEIERDFELSCCSHLLAVSGTHFSGFLVCVPVILNLLNIKRKRALAIHTAFCVLTGCLTGWGDSVTRAAVMSICVFADREWVSALSLASVMMITADPFCVLSSGFQMSFCAVIAIKMYSGRISDLIMRFCHFENISKVTGTAVAASLGIIPFWSDISMRPDPEHLVIQTAGSFVAGAACTFFIPCFVLCSFFPFWNRYLSDPLSFCLKALSSLVNAGGRLSEQSGASVHLSKALLVMTGVFIFLYMMPSCMFRRAFIRPAAAVLAFVIGFEAISVIEKPDCRVVFADVGQGDCCLIITPDKTCLIDAGTYKEGSSTVCDLLDYYGIFRVDVCIMSHWDVDHAGGIAALFEKGRTKSICTSHVPLPEDRDKDVLEFFDSVDPEGALKPRFLSGLSALKAGDRIELSGSVYFDVIYPPEDTGGGNESSLVLMLHVNGGEDISILFTGDIGASTEAALIEAGAGIDCDILKVAHHGSKYSSSSEFVEACSPDIAVISVGAHNLYGHPSPETLERLESYGCDVFRTDTGGAVILEY